MCYNSFNSHCFFLFHNTDEEERIQMDMNPLNSSQRKSLSTHQHAGIYQRSLCPTIDEEIDVMKGECILMFYKEYYDH